MKMALILNTNALGGAERSMIEQLQLVKEKLTLEVFLPRLLQNENKLRASIENNLSSPTKSFRFPSAFYQLHQKSDSWQIFFAMISLLFSPLLFTDLKELKKFEVIYCNGNKAASWIIFWALFTFYKGRVVWHFRDYPEKKRSLKWIILLSEKFGQFNLSLVANSFSVKKAIETELSFDHAQVIYNKTAKMTKRVENFDLKKIGVVAMMAPWKGIHQMILFANLYEKELCELGVEELSIYSASIYQTQGEHREYHEELKKLLVKFPSRLVKFHFDKNPQEIFTKIDLLIHPSLKPEPFGRVILEAFKSGVPVISTALGGAGELVRDEENSLVFFKHDHHGLFRQIEKLIINKKLRSRLIEEAAKNGDEIEANVKIDLERLLGVA